MTELSQLFKSRLGSPPDRLLTGPVLVVSHYVSQEGLVVREHTAEALEKRDHCGAGEGGETMTDIRYPRIILVCMQRRTEECPVLLLGRRRESELS